MPKPVSRRRGLLVPDPEVRTWLERLQDRLRPYLKWLFLGLGIVVVAVAGWSLTAHFRELRAQEASRALAPLRARLSDPQAAPELLPALEKLIQSHPHTPAELEARLFRAHLLYQQGKFEEAREAYLSLAADSRVQGQPGLRVLVAESLSYCEEALGRPQEAAATLKPVVEEVSGALQGELWRRYAMLAEAAGQTEEARRAWEKLLERPPVPAMVPYLKEKLAATSAQGKPSP